jgi:2-haloacid dehalogenase
MVLWTYSKRRGAAASRPNDLCACLAGLILVAGVAVAFAEAPPPVARRESAGVPRFKAIAFDYFVLFNPDSVVPEAERVFPGKGRELTNLWRTRQFEYSWLRSITDHYVDFFAVTEDALVFAANAMKLKLTPDDKRRLLDAFLRLTPWDDTADALRRLKETGIRVITLANFSPAMLRSNAENAGLIGFFDALVSTDANHTYKPDPRAYQLGVDRLHLAKQDILFVAFGGWDAAGAKSFGYPTFWVNRFNQPFEELGVRPDRTSTGLDGLLDFVLSNPPAAERSGRRAHLRIHSRTFPAHGGSGSQASRYSRTVVRTINR